MFMDENPNSINDGAFFNSQTDRRWIQMPAKYRNGADGLPFLDAHSKIKMWKSTVRLEKGDFQWALPQSPRGTLTGPGCWIALRTARGLFAETALRTSQKQQPRAIRWIPGAFRFPERIAA